MLKSLKMTTLLAVKNALITNISALVISLMSCFFSMMVVVAFYGDWVKDNMVIKNAIPFFVASLVGWWLGYLTCRAMKKLK